MLEPTVHASLIAVAGEWARYVTEVTKPHGENPPETISLLRRNFELAYKELVAAIKIYEPREKE